MKQSFINQVQGHLIVSCQALEDEPLHSSFIMARMARAAKQAGARGLRANSIVDIQAIQDETDLPIIGIIKRDYPDSPVYITPTLKEMRAVAATGVAVVATDCTNRNHPGNNSLKEMLAVIHQEYPQTLLMADTGNLDDENASRLMELFIQMNKTFGTTIILATHSTKLMDTYKFPVIHVENHKVSFIGAKASKSSATEQKKLWKGPKPQNYFTELSKQFDDIGNA